MTSFTFADYLQRIHLKDPVAADVAGLEALQRAHRLAIPFENLDVMLGRGIAIDSDAVFAKLVTARRGGYCFEHNRLFLDALAAAGFTARPQLARVWLGAETTPPLTHAISIVTVEGAEWIADAGFGGSYTPPMPLIDGAEAIAPDGARFRLSHDGERGWMLWRAGDAATTDGRGGGEGFQPQYSFTPGPAHDADLAMGNLWAATAPGSRFHTTSVVSIVLPRGFASLTDRAYRRRSGSEDAQTEITDPRVYRLRLSMMFGIDLSADEVARLGLFAG
ncbi:arylamine N-acetyltransferase [Sphingomonas sp. H39-1-10]|uniref:arylamine N-acetyltransferase family protein n=1 Tax=Sphingomonas pollutisoli TaxID=3030829 RepID=UPI0023B96014|nr:arylamine N-acetyltransferase [Sphingomonas pollutisoli]MDF0489926.1 arylamine N-acetyltransferase [Sphingomonas pollutisoli]